MARRYTVSTRDATLLWPRVPSGNAAAVLAVHAQNEQSQWLSPDEIEARQFTQLRVLLRHCLATVPYYQGKLAGRFDPDAALDWEAWRRLPVLTRADLQEYAAEIETTAPPASHGRTSAARSSGSTGRPVEFKTSEIVNLLYFSNNLRQYRWHDYDPEAVFTGIIRLNETQRKLAENRTPVPWMKGYATGPFYHFDVGRRAAEQWEWLREIRPRLLTTYPSNLKNLVAHAGDGDALPLEAVTTMSEVLDPDVREICEAALGAPIHDIYSAQELGIVALQCPDSGLYHAMAESVLVEILDGDGQPCAPGAVGRLVVTPLHNFITPLIRYEVGDYAEAGAPCDCGRGLPSIRRILGRQRNMLVLPDGEKVWPAFGSRGMTGIAPVRQHQIIQKAPDRLEARLVVERPLTAAEELRLAAHITGRVPAKMAVAFTYLDEIPRSASGKFEDFMSEV